MQEAISPARPIPPRQWHRVILSKGGNLVLGVFEIFLRFLGFFGIFRFWAWFLVKNLLMDNLYYWVSKNLQIN
jgi:hypothetical protein